MNERFAVNTSRDQQAPQREADIPQQVIRQDKLMANLEDSLNRLENKLQLVIKQIPIPTEVGGKQDQPSLCALAQSLYNNNNRIQNAINYINRLTETVEL